MIRLLFSMHLLGLRGVWIILKALLIFSMRTNILEDSVRTAPESPQVSKGATLEDFGQKHAAPVLDIGTLFSSNSGRQTTAGYVCFFPLYVT